MARVGEPLAEDDTDTCSQLPPPMSCSFTSTSLLNARSSADVTSSSGHVTQPADAGIPPQPATRPTTLSVTDFVLVVHRRCISVTIL